MSELRKEVLGRVDMKEMNSWIEVDRKSANQMIRSIDGKKFKGRVNLAQCLFCGEGESNGAIAVMYRDMAEMDDWRAIYSASEDFSEWAASVNAVASFPGNSLIVNLQRFD